MSAHRCSKCEHRSGPRVVTPTSKRRGGVPVEPRQHKKPCDCACHAPTVEVAS